MSLSRRGFLTGMLAGAGVAATRPAQAAGAKAFKGYSGRYGLLHDTTLCVGCRECEAACSKVNKLPAPVGPLSNPKVFEQTRRSSDTLLTVVNRYGEKDGLQKPVFRKQQCMHCNEPCCASVCFVKAFTKTPEGPVLYNPDVCVGCRYCVMACPYDALAYEYEDPLTPKVMRCTMCYDRIKDGKLPACAQACPKGAITFGKRKDLIKVARERIRKNPDKYIDHIFGEKEFGGTSWLMLAGVSFGKLGLHENAPSKPIPEYISGFLSVVPLVITIYPGLLAGMYAFTKRKEHLHEVELQTAVSQTEIAGKQALETKLKTAQEKSKQEKEKAVEAAVKKTLAEALKNADGKEAGK